MAGECAVCNGTRRVLGFGGMPQECKACFAKFAPIMTKDMFQTKKRGRPFVHKDEKNG